MRIVMLAFLAFWPLTAAAQQAGEPPGEPPPREQMFAAMDADRDGVPARSSAP